MPKPSNAVVPGLADQVIETLQQKQLGPGDMDHLLRGLGAIPLLLNPFGATTLNDRKLGNIVAIPVHIGPGGRKSLYELAVGEKVLSHLFVAGQAVYVQFWERLSGQFAVADGDRFRREVRGLDGKLTDSAEGAFRMVDETIGHGQITVDAGLFFRWIAWSFYADDK